ncbi:hypothetical protein [Amycolatopsis magusensis]|uniref:hypothetical protein n=1 Tax=Amycolatopsis magusensis TaxID=882444 RepID=UPI003C2E3D0B
MTTSAVGGYWAWALHEECYEAAGQLANAIARLDQVRVDAGTRAGEYAPRIKALTDEACATFKKLDALCKELR